MLKNIVRMAIGVAMVTLASGATAWAATRTVTGRVTAVSSTSVSALDNEIVTLTLDSRTAFTKWVTQKPWEQDTRLSASALRVGQYVAIHRRREAVNAASWVQIATDVPALLGLSRPLLNPVSGAANDRVAQASPGDLLSSSRCWRSSRTPGRRVTT